MGTPDVPTLGDPLSWDHIYLLGWYNGGGRSFLSSWSGDLPRFEGVVTNASPYGPPLWDAPVGEAKVYALPSELEGVSLIERCRYAQTVDGVYVIGWRMTEPVNRTPKIQKG